MNRKLKVIISCLCILIIMHYKKYKKYASDYNIDQQELDYVNGNELYNQLHPLIITFIENESLQYNVTQYLKPLLSFQNKFILYNTNNRYISHYHEQLLIRSKNKIVIELINPKYKTHFKNIENKQSIFNEYELSSDNFNKVKSIDIVVREYNILYIPRHWLFKFGTLNEHIEMYSTHNIFTYLFQKF